MIYMSFRVMIAKHVDEQIRHFDSTTDTFVFYGYYAQKDGSLQVLDAQRATAPIDPLQTLELKKGPLDLVGWGYVRDPSISFIPLDNFRVQTKIQDVTPRAVMCIIDRDPDRDLKIMWINGLKLEKVPYSVEEAPESTYSEFITKQQTLETYTDREIFNEPPEPPVATKKGMIEQLLEEMGDKVAYLSSLGKDVSQYEDYHRAKDLVSQQLYGRAAFYLRKVQRIIEEDVVQYRYKERYEQMLETLHEALPPELQRATQVDESDLVASLEMRLNKAASHYHVERYKEAYAELSSVLSDLPAIKEAKISAAPPIEPEPDVLPPLFEPIFTPEELERERSNGSTVTVSSMAMEKLEGMEDPYERLAYLERIQKEEPLNMWVWGEIGDNFFEVGELDKAVAAYKSQLKKTPSNAMVLNNLGMIYKLQFHYRHAIEFFKKSIAADPNYADAYYNLGFISFEEGDLEEAIENYKKAIELNPEFNLARESLAVAVRRQESYAHQNFSWKKDQV